MVNTLHSAPCSVTQVPVELCSLSKPGSYLEIENISIFILRRNYICNILYQTAETAGALAGLVGVTSASLPELKHKTCSRLHGDMSS